VQVKASSVHDPLVQLRHDLRAQFHVLVGTAELLVDEAGSGAPVDVRSSLRLVAACGRRMLAAAMGAALDMEREAGASQVPVGAHVRFARLLGPDLALVRDELDFLRSHGAPDADLAAMLRAVEQIAAFGTGRIVSREAGRPPGEVPASDESDRVEVPHIRGHILVVDESPDSGVVIARRLALLGHEVRRETAVHDAMVLLQREEFDLVVVDVRLPAMEGFDLLGRIRASAALRHLPVIMVSALDAEASFVRCLEMGADDFVAEPFDPAYLKARVGASLEKKRLRDAEVRARSELEAERARVEDLLQVILPREVLPELKAHGSVRPRRYENVAVLFCDVCNFTRWCDQHSPEEVVDQLRRLVGRLEDIAALHGLQKIKTIGDSFMAAAGMLRPTDNPSLDCVRAGLDMVGIAGEGLGWEVRVGIHVGPVVAGVVGRTQYLFDLWGDTVNTAARCESGGVNGAVCVTRAAWEAVAPYCVGTELPPVEAKGKGALERWRIERAQRFT
jgi:adenylate cyclase